MGDDPVWKQNPPEARRRSSPPVARPCGIAIPPFLFHFVCVCWQDCRLWFFPPFSRSRHVQHPTPNTYKLAQPPFIISSSASNVLNPHSRQSIRLIQDFPPRRRPPSNQAWLHHTRSRSKTTHTPNRSGLIVTPTTPTSLRGLLIRPYHLILFSDDDLVHNAHTDTFIWIPSIPESVDRARAAQHSRSRDR